MAKIVGDQIKNLPFFNFKRFNFNSLDLLIARSGYSKQGGFEIYVEDSKLGEPIWDILFEAGANMDVKAGCPNLIERIEAGHLSYGNDMTNDHTPHQSGLSKFCDTQKPLNVLEGMLFSRELLPVLGDKYVFLKF